MRRDALPEHAHWKDTGCSWHPDCLTCPFERCRFDDTIQARERARKVTPEQIIALRAQGLTTLAIAAQLGVCKRTIYRNLERARA